jgi:beta-phosphoglucomutase-like phosphatase (HAD superfamily)
MPAFIFDIDGTMIDSMPFHMKSWEVFLARHGRGAPPDDFFRRTGGRTAREVMRELFGALPDAEADGLAHEKEVLYRELSAADFREIAGFTAFARSARAAGVRMACARRASIASAHVAAPNRLPD